MLHAAAGLPVAQDLRRLGTQALGGIFGRQIPLLIEEVEPGRERIRRLDVEVILRDLVIAVADIAEGNLQVLVDLVVHLGHRAPLVLGIQFHGNGVDIGDAEIFVAGIGVVVQAEEVDQHEMAVGAAEQRLRHLGGQSGLFDGLDIDLAVTAGHPLDGLERLVGVRDGIIGVLPEVLRAVVRHFRHIFPGVALVHEAAGTGIVVTDIVHVVGHVLAEGQIGIVRIGRSKQRTDFLLGADFRPVVGHLVQELVASRQGREGSEDGDGFE